MVSVDSVFATYDVDCQNLKDYANNKMQYVYYTIYVSHSVSQTAISGRFVLHNEHL